MIAYNYFSDDEDLKLLFDRCVDWASVVEACEGKDFVDHQKYLSTNNALYEMAPSSVEGAVELYSSTLESLGDFFGNYVSQLSATFDKVGLKYENGVVQFPKELVDLYEKFRDTGLMPYSMPREAGGLGLPATMSAFYSMVMCRGDVSFSMTINLLNLAQIVARYGTEKQIEDYAMKASSGETLFAMALTEPDFGSDLNSVKTVAKKQEDGTYIINGTKRFISQGCGLGPYPATLLTLARTGSSTSGARGLSVFLVSSSKVSIAGIEKKLGIHASPTCEVVYENTPGELLGQEGHGLTRCTLGMTNFMRLGSAAGGCGGGAASYHESLKYAKERIQFGKPIIEIPAVAEMLDKLRRETNAMRLLTLETAFAVDMYQHHQIRLEKQGWSDREIRQDETIKTWNTLASLLTPIAKFYCSEEGLKCASTAIQIHGGVGYTEEFEVARFLRDARINTIYEGTSQIQVRLAVGGIIAGMTADGYFRKYLNKISQGVEFSSFLEEHKSILENSILDYRNISDDSWKEKFAEDLVVSVARFFCGVLYSKAVEKIKDTPFYARWKKDCIAYQLDSTAIAQSSAYRIKNAEKR